jgi:hypothetical protein
LKICKKQVYGHRGRNERQSEMSRLIMAPCYFGDHGTVEAEASPDGVKQGTGTMDTNTTVHRSGSGCIRCGGTSTLTSYRAWGGIPLVGYSRPFLRITALPSATKKIFDIIGGTLAAPTGILSVRLTAAGKLQLWNERSGAVAQIGADSAYTVELDRWFALELYHNISTASSAGSANDNCELRVREPELEWDAPGVTVAAGVSIALGNTAPAYMRAGWIEAPGVTSDMFLADVGLNDNAGTVQASWLGDEHIVFTGTWWSQTAVAPDWHPCVSGNSQIETVNALDTSPPTGAHADATGHSSPAHQIRNASSSATLSERQHQVYAQSMSRAGVVGNLLGDSLIGGSFIPIGGYSPYLYPRAQGFFLYGTVEYVELSLKKVGNPTDDLTIAICEDDGTGYPSTTEIHSASINGVDLSTTEAWIRFNIRATLAVGVRYWITVTRSGAASDTDYYLWQMSSGSKGPVDRLSAGFAAGTWQGQSTLIHGLRVFTSAGYSKINVAQAIMCHGASAAGISGSLESLADPLIASNTFTFGGGLVAGNYPTNWRWHKSIMKNDPSIRSADACASLRFTKLTQTTNVALCCFAGMIYAYTTPPGVPYEQYTKIADSTLWWAKLYTATTEIALSAAPGGKVLVPSGNWAIMPDPLPDGTSEPASITVMENDDFVAAYTRVDPQPG